jgi:predicted RNA-binding protein with RPS1 domain
MDPHGIENQKFTDEQYEKYLVTTLGKMIFNKILPESFPYLNEPTEDNLINKTPDKFFIPKGVDFKTYFENAKLNEPFKKKFLGTIIAQVFKVFKINETSKMLDKLKDLGFKYSTIAGITISALDVNVYSKKGELIEVEVVRDVERGAEVSYNGVLGFLPVNEVSSSKRVTNVSDEFAAGTKINAMVIDCDPSRAKLVVSVKAVELAKERESFDSYMKEQDK